MLSQCGLIIIFKLLGQISDLCLACLMSIIFAEQSRGYILA